MTEESRAISVRRVAGVAVGLMVSGGVMGAALSAALLGLFGSIAARATSFAWSAQAFLTTGGLGAALGAVAAPLAAFTVLRRVPIGVAVAGTVLGAALGASAGYAFGVAPNQLGVSLGAGAAGLVLASVALRFLFRPRKAK
jgi:hypothetical protein